MPLIRRAPPAPGTETPASLESPDPADRRAAVRAMAVDPASVEPLARALARESDAATRGALFGALAKIGTEPAARALLPFLESDDPAVRSGALDALQGMPDAVLPLLPGLLSGEDSDLRILSAELARHMPAERSVPLLAAALDRETHANAAAAFVEVLAEIGTAQALPALDAAAARFSGDPFLPFAIAETASRIRSGNA